jgi:hypothetical protein
VTTIAQHRAGTGPTTASRRLILKRVSLRKLAKAAGLGPTRVHRIVHEADLDGFDAVGELRSLYGWPAPEDSDGPGDEELCGRELIADRLQDEVEWLRDCARWLAQLEFGRFPPVISMRPDTDRERYNLIVDAGRIRRILLRVAADVDELARARRVDELDSAAIDPDQRAERRRRLAEPPLAFPRHGTSTKQWRQALYDFERKRWQRGEVDEHPFDWGIYPPEGGNYGTPYG